MVLNNGIWRFPEQMGEKGYVGFIYLITDPYMESFYLGKKHYRVRRGQFKGNESDWRVYKSSSKSIQAMLGERSLSDFSFYCIEEYKTAGGLSYAETWSLCAVNAPLSDAWYNKRIEKVSWKVNEPVSERHIERMKDLTRSGLWK